MRWTLWQWLPRHDDWLWLTVDESDDADHRAVVLRGYRKRNPRGTRLKWKQGEDKPKRFRARRTA